MNKDKVYIFDISGYLHRAYHTNLGLETSYGFPTGTIFGTLNMMLRFISKYQPTHMLVCYDAQTPKSVRKDIYPLYKANRIQTTNISAEELVVRRFFELLSISSVEAEGYEADDLISTATESLKATMDIVIVTGDKDLLQLIEPGVQVLDTMKNIWYDEVEAQKKFGVKASQIADYLAIAGDAADNIPGVTGIGPKGAAKLLNEYESVFRIYENINSVEKKLRDKLEKCKQDAFTSYRLALLMSVPGVNITHDSVRFQPKDNPDLYSLLEKLEIKSLGIKIELMWQAYAD